MRVFRSLAVLLAASPAAAGTLHDVDIILSLSEDRITTSRVLSGTETAPDRVFDADMIFFFGNVVTDDPGYDTLLGAFPPFTVMSLDMAAPLKVWNGSGFEQVIPEHFLEIEFNNQVAFSPESEDVLVTGPLMNISEFGDLHNHADYFLEVDQEPGIYLGTFRFTSDTVGDSEDFYLVYRWEPTSGDVPAAEAEQQVAIQWVRDNLLADPCPTDLDGDGVTGSGDLGALLAAWGGPDADLDGDGVTASGDLGVLLAAWGACE